MRKSKNFLASQHYHVVAKIVTRAQLCIYSKNHVQKCRNASFIFQYKL